MSREDSMYEEGLLAAVPMHLTFSCIAGAAATSHTLYTNDILYIYCISTAPLELQLAHNTLPAVAAVLRSLVCVFFKPFPA